ncbi:MAG: ABC-2 family transporter protein [Oscillospiraceae bacterium]|jgi:ABC-2 type transport system permease protein|nr:ABC-2 family transporter protein [Oscillospiraceae bacterium]
MHGFRLYFRLVGISLRSQWQYRANMILLTLSNVLGSGIEFLGLWALFGRFGALGGWTLWEAGLFYGIGNMAFALCEAFFREFDQFANYVREGGFDRVLLRPRSTVLQLMGAQVQLLRFGRFAQGLAVLVISISQLGLVWSAAQWMLLVMAIIGGALLFGGIIVLQAVSCFFTVESLEIWNSITFGGVYTIQYPLDVYHKLLKHFFMYVVPLAAINYWPCAVLLGHNYAPAWLGWLAPFIGAGVFIASLGVWQLGVRHYRSTGS